MKMIHYLLGALLLSVGFTGNIKAQVSNENEDGVYKIDSRHANDYVPGQVLFKLKDGHQAHVRRTAGMVQSAGISSLDAVLKEFEVQDMEQLLPEAKVSGSPRRAKAFNGDVIVERDLTQLYRVVLPEEKADKTFEMIEQLKKLDEVEFAEPNYKVYIMVDDNIAANYSNNPMVGQQWYLDAYGVKELWNKPIINKSRPVIAIIDTGVDITHPDLKDNIWTKEGTDDEHGYDFVNSTTKMRDNNSHGTHVAGIAAAANNGVGIVGANPRALIMPITVMQSDGTGDMATIVKGIDYAVKNKANVLNLSLGTYANSNAMRQALEIAYQSAVIVAAAGNDGKCIYTSHAYEHKRPVPMPSFPGAYSFVLGVQATTPSGELASFTNYDDDGPMTSCESTAQDPDGFNYELKAPGTKILSCIPGGSYKELQGTSMATPLAAGAISALMMVKQYDNQEILWGDLLHSNNIAGAYSINKRPAELDVMRIMLRDRKELANESEDDFSDDQEIDAGETVRIYPIVRTSFGKASNIRLRIEGEAPLEVLTGEADFGFRLDAYGRAVSKNPLVIKVPNEMANATRLNIRIIATCNESDKSFEFPFKVKINNMWTIKGLLTEDRTLSSDHVYYVSSSLGINEGVTLTIEPGTRLEFAEDAGLYSFGKLIANGTPEKPIVFTGHEGEESWNGVYSRTNDTISYCRLEGFGIPWNHDQRFAPYLKDCRIITPVVKSARDYYPVHGIRNVLSNINLRVISWGKDLKYSNIINCENAVVDYMSLSSNNIYGNNNGEGYYFYIYSSELLTYKADEPSYLGTTRDDLIRPHIREMGNNLGYSATYGTIDLSNILKEPIKDTHGIVWKILVNGKDAQDEQEELLPLGVGKHKFEVYFNRPMNTKVIPEISFGVISPYNQHPVTENGSWNDEGTIYTAYVTIDGKTQSDGMNRIYVRGAEDNEFFECPYEATRFNIMVQGAGSMASGFQADAGLGCVNLKWNNENNDFEDSMGFNVYRYTASPNPSQEGEIVYDTIRINEDILDLSATSYIDDNVTPGQTYYYYYKVLSTALQEYDVSNVVAATPLTATRGDANGSGNVDVADVVMTVNYVTGLQPKPFVFDAADMNSDKLIDIFDVVGIIRGILDPSLLTTASVNDEPAVYSIENGTLYVESPVSLGGVQVQLTLDERSQMEDVRVAEDLDGFETASAWLSDNDYLFLAYSMNGKTLAPGKHGLLHIGDAEIASLRLSDTQGKNVDAVGRDVTSVSRMGSDVMHVNGIYDLQGRKLSTFNSPFSTLKKGIYIINGQKVVK